VSAPVRVVVADDAEILRSLLVRAIDRDPRLEVVGQAANGREAVEAVHEFAPDVLLLDLSMPVLDGLGVLALVRDRCAVVVLTGYGDDDLGAQCRDQGARGFIEKGAPIAGICDVLAGVRGDRT